VRSVDDFLHQVDLASDAGLYYVALLTALTIPDIGGAMDASSGRASPETYKAWFDRYMAPKYSVGLVHLTGEDCYGLRCAMLHQGRFKPHRGDYSRVMFLEPQSSGGITMHMAKINDALDLDVRIFVHDMTDAGREWLVCVRETELYKRNYEHSMKRHPNGIHPFIVGLPVIG